MSQTEAFKVCVRIRPLNMKEQELPLNIRKTITHQEINDHESVCFIECPSQSVLATEGQFDSKQFVFDNVFDESQTTLDLYRVQIQDMLSESISLGYNATIFAYGMTGAGKSYTMFGDLNDSEMNLNVPKGIISLCYEQIFREKDIQKISISFIEIYNEQLRDLLCETQTQSLQIVDDPIRGVVVAEASEQLVESIDQVRQLVFNGNQRRVMAATQANQVSSRSHAIIQFTIVSAKYTTKLSLVDLAGSERASVTENRGLRMQEGANINKSLLALGNCINFLADKKKSQFVPYRDSKLTRILKDSLGGNTRTIMIGCVSPSIHCHEETLNTLKYASRARAIKKKIQQNIKPSFDNSEPGLVLRLQQEVQRLKQQLVDQKRYPESSSFQDSLTQTRQEELIKRLVQIVEEKSLLQYQLKELANFQRKNLETLQQQYVKGQGLEQLLDCGDETISINREEQFRLELQITRNEVQSLQDHIDENDKIRQQLEDRVLKSENERLQLENILRQPIQPQFDSRDHIILQLKRDLEFMGQRLTEKDDLIDKLRQALTQGTSASVDNDCSQRSGHIIHKKHFDTERREERSFDSAIMTVELSDEPPVQDTRNLNPKQLTPLASIRESRKDSTIQDRHMTSTRKIAEEQCGLMQLNKAREQYKYFRVRINNLREEIEMCVYNGQALSKSQVEIIKQTLMEIQSQKHALSEQDLKTINTFQQIVDKFNQTRQNAFNQPKVSTTSSRSKSANVMRKSSHQRQPLRNIQQNECSPSSRQVKNNLSKSRGTNQKIPPSGKMKESGIGQLLTQHGVPKSKLYENAIPYHKRPPKQRLMNKSSLVPQVQSLKTFHLQTNPPSLAHKTKTLKSLKTFQDKNYALMKENTMLVSNMDHNV